MPAAGEATARAKIEGQYRYLLRASRGDDEARDDVKASLDGLYPALNGVADASDRDSLRGMEGAAAVHYFAGLRKLLRPQVAEPLRSDGARMAARAGRRSIASTPFSVSDMASCTRR